MLTSKFFRGFRIRSRGVAASEKVVWKSWFRSRRFSSRAKAGTSPTMLAKEAWLRKSRKNWRRRNRVRRRVTRLNRRSPPPRRKADLMSTSAKQGSARRRKSGERVGRRALVLALTVALLVGGLFG